MYEWLALALVSPETARSPTVKCHGEQCSGVNDSLNSQTIGSLISIPLCFQRNPMLFQNDFVSQHPTTRDSDFKDHLFEIVMVTLAMGHVDLLGSVDWRQKVCTTVAQDLKFLSEFAAGPQRDCDC